MYLDDPVAAPQKIGSDTVDRNYLALSRWSAVSVRDYRTFVAGHGTFRVYTLGTGWLIKRLQTTGALLEETGHEGDARLFRVTVP
jgi:hypothetical protein